MKSKFIVHVCDIVVDGLLLRSNPRKTHSGFST